MNMISYVQAVKRALRDQHGFKPKRGSTEEDPCFTRIKDGTYVCVIDNQIDNVEIKRGKINCCIFDPEYPNVGDEWELCVPFTRRIVKTVGQITTIRTRDGKLIPYVRWKRLPKGRYSGVTLEGLVSYGKRLSTKAERDAAIDKRLAARRCPQPECQDKLDKGKVVECHQTRCGAKRNERIKP